MTQSLGNKAAKGAIWAITDRFGTMALQFSVNLILARLLLPEDFGEIGMLAIFIALSQVLIDSGFGSAIIQKKNPSQRDYSTVLYWNLIFSTILYLVLYICAPLVEKFYSMDGLASTLRGIGLTLILNSIFSLQKIRLQKQLKFKEIAISNLCSYILGSSVAIIMAYYRCGVWSLVAMQITYGISYIIILLIITKWYPSFNFSQKTIKELFSFGGYILAASVLQTVCQNIQGLVIGKKFSAIQMGYYSQASKLDLITSYSIPQVIVQVMYPVYSSMQDDHQRLNHAVITSISIIAFIVFPVLASLILIADPLIVLLYGEKWLPSAEYFQILCIGGYFLSLQNINYYAVAAIGKSKALFNWSIYKWLFLLTMVLLGMMFGIKGILWGIVISNINVYITNAYLLSKFSKLSIYEQIKAIIPIICVTGFSIIAGYVMHLVCHNIIIACISIYVIYLFLSITFRLNAVSYTKTALKQIVSD